MSKYDKIDDDALPVYVVKGQLLTETLHAAIVKKTPLAVDPSGEIWLWRNGCYVLNRLAVNHLVAVRLGDHFKQRHLSDWRVYAAARLDGEGRRLDVPTGHLINVPNGVLDPFTGELRPHDPSMMFTWQLPVEWHADATCPIFDAWLVEVLPNEALREAFMEDLSFALDMRRLRQKRAVMLIGQTRTGKSTAARIVTALMGASNTSSEELYDLVTNRFRAAQLYGRLVNVASDIRTGHFVDIGVFKKITGQDWISAERKFGQPFSFRYDGLIVWTLNNAPTVDEENSAPYLARVRPYRFDVSFLNREKPAIEAEIIANELPGVLVRLLEALRRVDRRDGYVENDETKGELAWFTVQTDRLATFLAECTQSDDRYWCRRTLLFTNYEAWCTDSHRGTPMSRHAFYVELSRRGFRRARRDGIDGFKGLDLVTTQGPDYEEGADDGGDGLV
jgi:putative DNA primase/helicase